MQLFLFSNLETATKYKVVLNAQYLFTQSEESEQYASTLALPPRGPFNFTHVTESGFVAHWRPPETNPFPVGYIVTYMSEGEVPLSIEGINTTFWQ